MKFRKINEDKIQIILTTRDLEERDFRHWAMMPMSPHLQEFFHDLLERAYKECGFEISDDSQLVVEAYPLNADTFAIILTRIPAGIQAQGEIQSPFHIGHLEREAEDELEELERDCQQVWCFDD
ncbi:MAG: adaptor protein MecA, partial [Peptococcaceae bacterium]|nr:adaptor protein MecA [Peptococcaceae bacterium]